MPKLRVTGRMAALAGISAAAATATLVAIAGPAMAAPNDELPKCTEQVNVRDKPTMTGSKVIGSCGPNEQVTTGKTENGFVYLENKRGWASTQYVKEPGEVATSGSTGSSSKPSSGARPGSNNDKKNDDSDDGLLGGL